MLIYMSNSTQQGRSTPLHSVSVAGVVVREDGQVLVIRRADNNTWEPPGGVLELGESVEAGVAREVREETGVDVAVERLTGVYKNMALGVVALVFRCRPVGGAPQTSDESTDVRWLRAEDALAKMGEMYAIRVQDALHSDVPAVRAHDGRQLVA
ncbi:NUDIX domain-containing protein [Kitasatospora sp. GP82]|uniref:NUDIX hydrolase n=1 Tax=Kitasatospora sp. GP82 TaxID=3035089 RepID=UPI0024733529|nr:NUDIX domain-containing protein [Kitasatospora sp. GP82]MDH6126912.1 8-oxo-dGTP diphosphatase [Kitasatospora sp. GP82]